MESQDCAASTQGVGFVSPVARNAIEFIRVDFERGRVRHALFDFDGTISLIREGWQGVMIPMMVEFLLQTPRHEPEAEVEQIVRRFVSRLTGKQTIYQMIQLCEEIRLRGGDPKEPLFYKWEYLSRLQDRIRGRLTALGSGELAPDDLLVPGARRMLDSLRQRDIACYLASGTDQPFVVAEAKALRVDHYFAGIYGAQDDYLRFSKKLVIERIFAEHHLSGPELVAFGDGYVEIEDTKAAGGIAVGVASDEARRMGIDVWKRARLIEAGADIIIPDFRPAEELVSFLCAED
jgi:phosphoglycolate phosphatase-like HAD superfamily hydrolase